MNKLGTYYFSVGRHVVGIAGWMAAAPGENLKFQPSSAEMSSYVRTLYVQYYGARKIFFSFSPRDLVVRAAGIFLNSSPK